MRISTYPPQPEGDTLLSAYKDRVRAEIEKELTKDMEPIIRRAAQEAADSLEVTLQSMRDELKREMLVKINLNITDGRKRP